MVQDFFWLQLIASFIVGGLWVTLATLAAEHFGSRIGGVIGGFPSTVLIAFLFLGMTQSTDFVVETTTLFPLTFAINGFFSAAYAILIPRGIGIALTGAGLIWFVLQVIIINLYPVRHFGLSLVLWAIILCITYYLLEYTLTIHSHRGIVSQYRFRDLLGRAVFSGGAIAMTVLMGKLGGPLLGSVFAAFPAVFVSTLVIAYCTRGATFSRTLTKPLALSGLINCVVYATAIRYLYPLYGLVIGTVAAASMTLISTYCTYRWLRAQFS